MEWIRFYIKNLDRIYRILRIFLNHFPEENGQTTSPAAKEFIPIHRHKLEKAFVRKVQVTVKKPPVGAASSREIK